MLGLDYHILEQETSLNFRQRLSLLCSLLLRKLKAAHTYLGGVRMMEALMTGVIWAAITVTLWCFYDFILDIKDKYF